eukprot:g907.t1
MRQERFHAEQLLEQGYEQAALARLRRVVNWAGQLGTEAASVQDDVAAAKTAIGWALASCAAPILDSGNVHTLDGRCGRCECCVLLAAQKQLPDDKRVQEELRKVKIELRKEEEQQSRSKVVEIRDGLKRARTEGGEVLPLLRQLSETRCSWDTVMDRSFAIFDDRLNSKSGFTGVCAI